MISTESFLSDSKSKSIFITGATGFFGRSLLDFFIKNVIEFKKISILSRDPEAFLANWPLYAKIPGLDFIKGDVENFVFNNSHYDYILHFATPASATMNLKDPTGMTNVILNGTRHVLNFAIHCKASHILFTSSGAVYGVQPTDLSHIPETYIGDATGSAYGEAKRLAEIMGCEYAAKYN
ncbi:MAG: NAD(P)-dependent oxidoreductase, partial [Pseudobdellovibrio sp.]